LIFLQSNVKKAKNIEDNYMSDEDDIDKEPFDEVKVTSLSKHLLITVDIE